MTEQRKVRSMASKSARSGSNILFLSEEEVARLHNRTPGDWAATAILLERDGFPRIDPIIGGRHKEAISAFWRKRYGLSNIDVAPHDGEENLDALG